MTSLSASPVSGCIEIPPGSFLMGGIADDKFVSAVELPQHPVNIGHRFELGITPVTRRQWVDLMGTLPPGCRHDHSDDCPVVGVSYSEVHEYLRELTSTTGTPYRLPTESEWEYACRAGSTTVFPHGTQLDPADANFLYDERGESVGPGALTPVARYGPNRLGIFDLLGNVCEWTVDVWHAGYTGAPADGSAWTVAGKSGCRTIRGGAWDHLPRVLRASWREWAPESARWDNLGFRIARSL